MRIMRVATGNGPLVALLDGEELAAAEVEGRTFADLPELLAATGGELGALRRGAALGRLGDATLLAPVARPRKLIGIGLNYRAHAAETGAPIPAAPPLFAKWDNAIAGPYDDVPLPSLSSRVDYESELAFIVGRRARNAGLDDTARVLLGYTCANDVSARDFQQQTSQWTAGKAFDGFCPLGPWIVTVDELGPTPDLAIRGRLAGELMQDSRTSDLIYSVPELVRFLSSIMTLEPGDVVLTGTPAGVGMGRTPPRWIQPGETYEVEIEGIGSIRNHFVAE